MVMKRRLEELWEKVEKLEKEKKRKREGSLKEKKGREWEK